MPDTTRILAFRSLEAAQYEAGKWAGSGHNVSVVLQTDTIRLSHGTQPGLIWDSGANEDWTLVIVSEQEIVPIQSSE